MRRLVLVLPNLLVEGEDPSPLRQKLPTLTRMSEEGEVLRLLPSPQVEVPEAFWLGMAPSEGQMKQGPLTISALGADPPERSIHFHLSLMTLENGVARQVTQKVPEDVLTKILGMAPRLNTGSLTFVKGYQADHGLVWEELRDLGTTPARELDGKSILGSLPDGEGDGQLRRGCLSSIFSGHGEMGCASPFPISSCTAASESMYLAPAFGWAD